MAFVGSCRFSLLGSSRSFSFKISHDRVRNSTTSSAMSIPSHGGGDHPQRDRCSNGRSSNVLLLPHPWPDLFTAASPDLRGLCGTGPPFQDTLPRAVYQTSVAAERPKGGRSRERVDDSDEEIGKYQPSGFGAVSRSRLSRPGPQFNSITPSLHNDRIAPRTARTTRYRLWRRDPPMSHRD